MSPAGCAAPRRRRASKTAGPASGTPGPTSFRKRSRSRISSSILSGDLRLLRASAAASAKNCAACSTVMRADLADVLAVDAAPGALPARSRAPPQVGAGRRIRDTGSGTRARAACTSCAPAGRRSRARPRSLPSPSITSLLVLRVTARARARPAECRACLRVALQVGKQRAVLRLRPRFDRAFAQRLSSCPGSPGRDRNRWCCRIPGSAGTRRMDC